MKGTIGTILLSLHTATYERRTLRTLESAYSSVSATTVCELLGVDRPRAEAIASERGWTVQGDMMEPKMNNVPAVESSKPEEVQNKPDWKLKQITDYISFLE